jgi:hypothetical protein
MTAERRTDELNYEQGLRIVGRHLDAEPAYHVRILEVDDGYVVRYQPAQYRSDDRTVHFSQGRLYDLFVFHASGRGCGPRRRDRHLGIWGKFPTGHEDFFRALGAVLDHQFASSLAVDELNDELRVSYMRPDPENPLLSQKCHAAYTEHDIRAMVAAARKLRGTNHLTLVTPAPAAQAVCE